MLFLIAVLAVFATAFLLQLFLRRQTRSLPAPPARTLETTHLRPLFEPDAGELKRQADEAEAREIAKREYQAKAGIRAEIDAAVNAWREHRDRRSVIELLRVTSESGRDGDLVRAAQEIVEFHGDTGITGLTDNDVAALIDSHLRLVSPNERGSGAYFWLKQEVARLASK